MVGKSVVDAGEARGRTRLTDGQPCGRVFATDVGLDGVEIADEGDAKCQVFGAGSVPNAMSLT